MLREKLRKIIERAIVTKINDNKLGQLKSLDEISVIIEKPKKDQKYRKGDIIAYQKDKHLIVHRIVDIGKQEGKTVYITKGDVNKSADSNAVMRKQIRGIVRIRIPVIAYPTVWLTELFYG